MQPLPALALPDIFMASPWAPCCSRRLHQWCWYALGPESRLLYPSSRGEFEKCFKTKHPVSTKHYIQGIFDSHVLARPGRRSLLSLCRGRGGVFPCFLGHGTVVYREARQLHWPFYSGSRPKVPYTNPASCALYKRCTGHLVHSRHTDRV